MKRVLWSVLIGLGLVLAVVYGLRVAQRHTSSGVASLLPRNTVAFAHLPDFKRLLDDWHGSDIYQIYREPAVQDFLQKPISRSGKSGTVSSSIGEFRDLDAKDAFVALISTANDQPKVVAGFEYRANRQTADRVIGNWRSKINPSAKREQIAYQKHDIEFYSQSGFSLAMVQDQNWFFASNDLNELKALLDRADGRIKDREALSGDEAFTEATGMMPSSYALLVYLQPKTLTDRLAALGRSRGNAAPTQPTWLQQVRSVCAATRFDGGKLHDLIFVGMPKQQQNAELTRSSVSLAGNATILYAASLFDFSKQVDALLPSGGGVNFLGAGAQKISNALASAGITPADWEAAFGSEIGAVSEWPEQTRWPSLIVTAPVKDLARGRKIIEALTHSAGQDERWEQADRDGAHYWFLASASSWLTIRPVIAISDRVWVAGLDASTVETVMRRAAKPEPGLADSDSYRTSMRLVPTPTRFFSYVDPGLFYSRLDAAVRPILLMGAAFIPAANDFVDLSKVPPAEVITKHLSPIVSSQYYARKGYVAESVGPITINQAGIGLGTLAGVGAVVYGKFMPGGIGGLGLPIPGAQKGGHRPASPPTLAAPNATPSPTTQPAVTP